MAVQNIHVMPDTLNNLIVGVQKGTYRVPQFQREYVWERAKVIRLFDSIYNEFPIGSFFLWKAGRDYNTLFRHTPDLGVPPIRDDDDVSFILDGQQRITSLYVTLLGLTAQGTDFSRICFDVREERFTYHEPDDKRFVSVSDIWGARAMRILRGLEEAHQEAYERCYTTLRTYPVSLVEVRDKDLPDVCEIFRRINQSGKRLDRFDLISAMTFSPEFDLRERFRTDVVEPLKAKAFGEISPAIVTQLLALVKKGACTQQVEFSLPAAEIREMWGQAVQAVLLAADTLRKCMGVANYRMLPYDAQLTLVAYFFAKSGLRAMTEQQIEWTKTWFWRSSFAQHYGAAGPTKMARDKGHFDALIMGEQPEFDVAMSLSGDVLVSTRMTRTESAIRNAFLCLLSQKQPLHLANNTPLDLVNGGISDFTSPEKHHIFPQAFLRENGSDNADVHALPNFCFLPAELNRRISDSRPSIYVAELMKSNPDFAQAAKAQVICFQDGDGLLEDDYFSFLKRRSELLLAEIERLTGHSLAPDPDERQKRIEKLELRVRDLLHTALSEAQGGSYWTSCIPADIREGVESRIVGDLKKHPDMRSQDIEGGRRKWDYCNASDYVKVITSKRNWPLFEPIFHRKSDVERYLEAFAEFRNGIAHGRSMSELTIKGGELAIIWLETVLARFSREVFDNEDEAETVDLE